LDLFSPCSPEEDNWLAYGSPDSFKGEKSLALVSAYLPLAPVHPGVNSQQAVTRVAPWGANLKALKTFSEVESYHRSVVKPILKVRDDPSTLPESFYFRGTPDLDIKRGVEELRSKATRRAGTTTLCLGGILFYYAFGPQHHKNYFDLSPEDLRRWPSLAHGWLEERFGENLLISVLHMRGGISQVHFMILTLGPKGEGKAKELFGQGRYYNTLARQFSAYMENKLGYEVDEKLLAEKPVPSSVFRTYAERSNVAEYSRIKRWVEEGMTRPRWTSDDLENQFYERDPKTGRNIYSHPLAQYYLEFGQEELRRELEDVTDENYINQLINQDNPKDPKDLKDLKDLKDTDISVERLEL
jgi:hypothetical protein